MEENLVKKTCKELGITQKKLSEITGFATQTISKWNRSSKMPTNAINHLNLILEYERLKNAFLSQSIDKNSF